MKKKEIVLSVFTLMFVYSLISVGCANNKKDVLFACDSTKVSYKNSVIPILTNNCYRCHSSGNAPSQGGGIILDNHSSIVNNWIDTDPLGDGGRLVRDIKGIDNPMPKNGNKLNACEIAKIEHWIKEGALNN